MNGATITPSVTFRNGLTGSVLDERALRAYGLRTSQDSPAWPGPLEGYGMQCPQSQHESPPRMRFCGQCAAPLLSACPACGAANPPEDKFCGQCAAPLPTFIPPPAVSPESYTPRHLAEKILMSKSALEGERKQVQLTTATTLYREMSMRFWLEQAADLKEAS